MDQNIIQAAALVTIWLWPVFKPGAEAFSKIVGKGLGQDFLTAARKLFNKVRPVDSEQARRVDANPASYHDVVITMVARTAESEPDIVQQVASGIWDELPSFLENLFLPADIRQIYSDLKMNWQDYAWSPATQTGDMIKELLDYTKTRGKLRELIEAMKKVNSYPFKE